MAKLFNEDTEDGADYQARAVREFLRTRTIEKSWNEKYHCYDAQPEIDRWYNGRERGYVVSLKVRMKGQINIAFFEHRSSDSIAAFVWNQETFGKVPTINGLLEAKPELVNETNYSFEVGYGKVRQMADFIFKTLEDFWLENS